MGLFSNPASCLAEVQSVTGALGLLVLLTNTGH